MQDAVVHAYMQMLHDVRQLIEIPQQEQQPESQPKDVELYKCWPAANSVNKPFSAIVTSFYRSLQSSILTPVVYQDAQFITLQQARFLGTQLAGRKQAIKQAAIDVYRACRPKERLLSVPRYVIRGFELAECTELLTEKTYDTQRFYAEIVMPNIGSLSTAERDVLLLYALEVNSEELNALLKQTPCIPTQPDGSVLARPADLVTPSGVVSRMYEPSDHRFPYGVFAERAVLKVKSISGIVVNVPVLIPSYGYHCIFTTLLFSFFNRRCMSWG